MTDWLKLHGESFRNTTALVTGGAGFIGSHITEALITLGAKVRVLDDLIGGDVANLTPQEAVKDGRITFIQGSILDKDLVAKAADGVDLM
jgi:UDP-glucose 4-epimerase